MNVVIYSRVSTNIQDYQRQTTELLEYAKKRNYTVLKTFEEKISGAIKNEDRPQLMAMVAYSKANNINKVLCWEISRIGRNTLEVLKTIQILTENKISLYIDNLGFETLNSKFEINPLTQLMVQLLTAVSEMEKTQIRQRIKSGYDNHIKNGGKVGRNQGYKKDDSILLEEHKDAVKLLKQGYSIRKVMKLTDKSSGTVQKIKKLIKKV